jgi:hypothetical protein
VSAAPAITEASQISSRVAARRHEHVGRFQIAMDDAAPWAASSASAISHAQVDDHRHQWAGCHRR